MYFDSAVGYICVCERFCFDSVSEYAPGECVPNYVAETPRSQTSVGRREQEEERGGVEETGRGGLERRQRRASLEEGRGGVEGLVALLSTLQVVLRVAPISRGGCRLRAGNSNSSNLRQIFNRLV